MSFGLWPMVLIIIATLVVYSFIFFKFFSRKNKKDEAELTKQKQAKKAKGKSDE